MAAGRRAARKRTLWDAVVVFFLLAAVVAGLFLAWYWNIFPKKTYTAEHFGIATITSAADYNENGVDDYTDLVLGARKDAENRPRYDGAYHGGGYPPEDVGVCTDLVWRAFREAGYSLKDMVDDDIAKTPSAYPGVGGTPDSNIDFRRVANLKVFFERRALSLTVDPAEIHQWQPGDIVTYTKGHIGIVSNLRNKDGRPYLIHNSGQFRREEDALTRWEINGHYRFDASLISSGLLIPWEDGE